jgi:hypothetical protein
VKPTNQSLLKDTLIKARDQENDSDHLNRAELEKLIGKRALPVIETSEVNKLPVKCKDIEFFIPQKEQVEMKGGLVDVESLEVEKKENNDLTIKDILNEQPPPQEQVRERKKKLGRMKELTRGMQDTIQNEEQKNNSLDTNKQKLDMLRTYINLIKEEIEKTKDNTDYLKNLENECIQVNELMKRIMPSIALGNVLINSRTRVSEKLVRDI